MSKQHARQMPASSASSKPPYMHTRKRAADGHVSSPGPPTREEPKSDAGGARAGAGIRITNGFQKGHAYFPTNRPRRKPLSEQELHQIQTVVFAENAQLKQQLADQQKAFAAQPLAAQTACAVAYAARFQAERNRGMRPLQYTYCASG